MSRQDPAQLYQKITSRNREGLAQGITLVESERKADRILADRLLELCSDHQKEAIVIGVTGVPGVGKSTVLDQLGLLAIEAGHRVAVLAIDPSSRRSKGSIMGDKTRMEELSQAEEAFIRPSPTSGFLGGASRRTREASILCAAAGYDRIFVETVGVGQNELMIDELADVTLLLLLAGAGDELQGIKRGIMEAADVMAINKADVSNKAASDRAATQLRNAISLLPARDSGYRPQVLTCSATEKSGISALYEHLEGLIATLLNNGCIEKRRNQRNIQWMNQQVRDAILEQLHSNQDLLAFITKKESEIASGALSPIEGAHQILAFMGKDPETPS
jgi:LAO/AO transport system kinase